MKLDSKTHIAIISHFSFKDKEKGAVFPQSIRDFLIQRMVKVTYIDHPFPFSNFPSSQIRIYEKQFKTYQLTSPKFEPPILILFIYQIFLTFFFMIRKPAKYDLCIACDNLSFISVFIFRKLGLIKRLIYYTVDYSPKRYDNFLLNSIYQYLDRLACRISDRNWVAVEKMIAVKVQNGLNLKECSPFQVVPMGFSAEDIVIKPVKEINRFNLVFVGLLFEKQGLQLVISALPKIIRKHPEIRLTVIGSGPYENAIKRLVEQQKVTLYVKLTGYIDDNEKIVKLLTDCGVGLATYVPAIGDYTYAADPSKIKLYLLCGLPVITTQVPPIAQEIASKRAGIVIDYSEEDLISGIEKLLKKDKVYYAFRKNALQMAKAYDSNLILDKAFRKL